MHLRGDLELEEIAKWARPTLTGWVRYYGRFYPSKLREELRTIDGFHRAMGVSEIQNGSETPIAMKRLNSSQLRKCVVHVG